MKEKCDNVCETCSVAGQIFCCLQFSKATNKLVANLEERINALNGTNVINPIERETHNVVNSEEQINIE